MRVDRARELEASAGAGVERLLAWGMAVECRLVREAMSSLSSFGAVESVPVSVSSSSPPSSVRIVSSYPSCCCRLIRAESISSAVKVLRGTFVMIVKKKDEETSETT